MLCNIFLASRRRTKDRKLKVFFFLSSFLYFAGNVIVSGHNTGYIIVWNAWGGWQVLSIKASGDAISDLAFFNLHGPGKVAFALIVLVQVYL